MKWFRRFIHEQGGAISIYLVIMVIPIFLFCALLIDFTRIKVAEKEAENAVKAAVRSVLSAFSLPLHDYGLFALEQPPEYLQSLFLKSFSGNLSGTIEADHFRFIDHQLEADSSKMTSIYSLANHTVFKKQILEEMKYRAPMIYSIELVDKFKKTGLGTAMSQARQFSTHAISVEKWLDERDEALDKAWDYWTSMHQKAATVYPFYETQLAALNELSGKVGIHHVEEVRQSLQDAKVHLHNLEKQLENFDDTISSLAKAAQGSAEAIRGLSESRSLVNQQVNELYEKISELEQLLEDTIRYASLLTLLKIRSTSDSSFLTSTFERFELVLNQAKKANDQLNEELRAIQSANSAASDYPANQVFQSIYVISREELDYYGAQAGASASLFAGLQAQLGSIWLFDSEAYSNASQTIGAFWQTSNDVFIKQGAIEALRNKNKANTTTSKKEQRKKAQPYLDQITKAMGSCSLIAATDPFKASYVELQGDPSQGSEGYYQRYMHANQQADLAQPVPELNFENADKANASAMSLLTSFESILTEVRDEFFVDEYAISKFNYRTLGMEKDVTGKVKLSKEASRPDSHPLTNQEVEYLLYGSNSCLGNYSLAYGEMFAFRLAVGTTEALLEPQIQALNVGSPLLVLLAAVAEGAVKAQMDMIKLVQGEAAPLTAKLGSVVTLTYKDYLRIFLLLHSRETVLLSRMQALIQLNTGKDLQQSTTYVSGTGGSSIKLWFIPGIMKALGASGLYPCMVSGNRCQIMRTGVMAY